MKVARAPRPCPDADDGIPCVRPEWNRTGRCEKHYRRDLRARNGARPRYHPTGPTRLLSFLAPLPVAEKLAAVADALGIAQAEWLRRTVAEKLESGASEGSDS